MISQGEIKANGSLTDISDVLKAYENINETKSIETELEKTQIVEKSSEKSDSTNELINLDESNEKTKTLKDLNQEDSLKEPISTGSVGLQFYYLYFKAGLGVFGFFIVMYFFVAARATTVTADYWLAKWTSYESKLFDEKTLIKNQTENKSSEFVNNQREFKFTVYSSKIV